MSGDARFLLSELAAVGPYFGLRAGPPSDGSGWRPARELIADAEQLSRVLDEVAQRLGAAPRWIAASVFYQGWAARLTSVYAGSLVLRSAIPDLAADGLRYRIPPDAPVQLLAAPLTAVDPATGWRRLFDQHLDPLAASIRGQVRVGQQLLRGNLASALAGSVAMLAGQGHGELAALISLDWAQPAEMRRYGCWRTTPDGIRYVRTTCCGYDLLPDAGRCADCSLVWRRPRS
jgi:iron complex transport system ATP-binding protein